MKFKCWLVDMLLNTHFQVYNALSLLDAMAAYSSEDMLHSG